MCGGEVLKVYRFVMYYIHGVFRSSLIESTDSMIILESNVLTHQDSPKGTPGDVMLSPMAFSLCSDVCTCIYVDLPNNGRIGASVLSFIGRLSLLRD